ncbi:MAG: endonuclease/exonuclease/phosphatase family protein [Solirubrobacteraceae bacterium]
MRRLLLLAGLASLILPAAAQAADPPVVISELRLRGPSGGSDEFVELRNAGSAPVDVGGWRLVGCSATGPTGERAAIPAATTIPGGGSYLFTNAGASGYSGTVPGDRTYGTGITDTGGVRLENGAGVVDAAGDDGSVCREGGGVSIPTSNADNGFERRGGTQDTDDNAADFTGPKPSNPQNLSEEGGGPQEPTVTRIHDIQGPGAASPKAGQTVTIEGVVTGIDDEIGANFTTTFPADAGIFVQEEPADADADPATSEGIFVGFVRNRGDYPPGTVVRLNGRVRENFGETRIEETVGQEPVALGTAPVPAPVVIDPAAAAAQDPGARAYYETLEGVNVRLAVGTATSGGRNKFGETYLTPGVNQGPEDRVFRTDVQPDLIAADSDAGAGDPDKPLKDTDSDTELAVDLFDVVRDLTGPVGFSFGNYKIINQVVPAIEDGPTPYPYTVPTATSDQLRIASFNLENFFPVGGDLDGGPVTLEEYAEKRGRLVDAIGRLLDRPDVVAVQEVHDLAVLTDLATRLGGYTAYLQEGNDSRGIDVGFLVRDTVRAGNVRQLGKDATAPPGLDCSDVDGGLFDRPPLAIDVDHRGAAFTLFSNHFSSKSAPDGCRAAQAAFVRDRVAELEAAGGEAIVAGDLNAFEDESALTTLEGPETSLDNLWDVPPAPERYSFQFGGRLQTLDHVLVTDGLAARVDDFRYAHFDNDYHLRRGVLDGHHVSDHDPPVLTLELVAPPVQKLRPLVLGKPKANHFVLGFPGLWTVEEGSLELTYRWLRCDTEDAGSCEAIGGATRLYYRVQKADRCQYLRFEVTAAGVGGSTVATSRPVAVK